MENGLAVGFRHLSHKLQLIANMPGHHNVVVVALRQSGDSVRPGEEVRFPNGMSVESWTLARLGVSGKMARRLAEQGFSWIKQGTWVVGGMRLRPVHMQVASTKSRI